MSKKPIKNPPMTGRKKYQIGFKLSELSAVSPGSQCTRGISKKLRKAIITNAGAMPVISPSKLF